MDSEGDGTRQTTVNVNPLSLRSIIKVQGKTARKLREGPEFTIRASRILYTTNGIEALNAKLRRAVRARGHFPTDEAAIKLLFLVLHRAEKEWIMPPREWTMAKAQFAILFGLRFAKAQA